MYAQHLGADVLWARRAHYTTEADAARLAARVRRDRDTPAPAPELDRLCIRILEPADARHLRSLFGRLSMRSRWLRYLAPLRSVSELMLRRLSSIDHDRHEALGAFDEGELIAVAHYIRDLADPARAEISVEVADSHQRRGIGQRLLNDLAGLARGRGIAEFTATALRENAGVLALVHNSDWPSVLRPSGPEVEIALSLPDADARPALALAPCF